MNTILTSLTEQQFDAYVRPFLNSAKRSYESKLLLYKIFNHILYQLHTGCQWERLLIDPDPTHPEKEINHAVYHHFRKCSRDGSLENLWKANILSIEGQLNLSELNLDGTHIIAKNGGESVAIRSGNGPGRRISSPSPTSKSILSPPHR